MRPLGGADIQEILAGVGPLWGDLRGARLLLTGCTGFLGPWLLEPLLAVQAGLGLEAWVLTRDPGGFRRRLPHIAGHPALHVLEGEVQAFRGAGVPFTHVVHGAASSNASRDPQGPGELRSTILEGTARVLEASGSARRILFVSSGAVYGTQPPDLTALQEDDPGTAPFTPYGLAKREAEALCSRAVIARCFAFLAPHLPLDAHFAAGNFLGDALAGRPIRIAGDGRPLRSYLYGTDLSVWLWTLLLRGVPGRAYNVGSDRPVSIADLARAVGGPVSVAQPPGEGCAERYLPSVRRCATELGLAQTVDLAEAIRRTLAWHRSENP